jgi:predicted nucleic acid-binding protein
VIYLDSSVLLEVYLGQARATAAQAILADGAPKVSSWLLAIEVPVTLRRVLGATPEGEALLPAALERFDADRRGVAMWGDLSTIAERVRQDARLSRCRSLDAVHAATALHLGALTGHLVRLATFDARLATLGRLVGLELIGAVGTEGAPAP